MGWLQVELPFRAHAPSFQQAISELSGAMFSRGGLVCSLSYEILIISACEIASYVDVLLACHAFPLEPKERLCRRLHVKEN